MLAASSTLPVVSSEQLLCCRWHVRLSPALCGCSSYYTLQCVPSWHKGTAVDHSCLTNMHACKECQQAAHEEDTLACARLLHKQHAPQHGPGTYWMELACFLPVRLLDGLLISVPSNSQHVIIILRSLDHHTAASSAAAGSQRPCCLLQRAGCCCCVAARAECCLCLHCSVPAAVLSVQDAWLAAAVVVAAVVVAAAISLCGNWWHRQQLSQGSKWESTFKDKTCLQVPVCMCMPASTDGWC